MTRQSSTVLMSIIGVVLGALAVGCGPAPGYEPEPRVPVGYEPVREPASSEELQMRAQVQAQGEQGGDVAIGETGDEYADTDPSALTEFKPALDGHGQWVDDATYGTVWVPDSNEVGADFEPYVTAGHWTYDDEQSWVWASDYDWGWAPFHYGRWTRISHHGWVWIPGRVYSGAWVSWRVGPSGYDYVGWAPMQPDWYWYNGYAVGWTFGYYSSPYWYCHHDYIYDRGWRGHAVYGGTPAGAVIAGRTAPYVPARPAPSHVAASPTVNGGGHVAAAPRVNGPRPSDIGVKQGSVVAPPNSDGMNKARALATPSTATKIGAAAPATTTRRPRPQDGVAGGVVGQPGRVGGGGGNDRVSPSVASRIDPVARSPQVVTNPSNAPRPLPNGFTGRVASNPSTSSSQGMRDSAPSAVQRPSVSTPSVRQPSSQPSISSQPRQSPTVTAQPSVRTPSVTSRPSSPSAPVVRSSPSVHSAPSTASPSFRSSSPSVHSAPSAPSRPSSSTRSAPSVSRGSSGGRGGRR